MLTLVVLPVLYTLFTRDGEPSPTDEDAQPELQPVEPEPRLVSPGRLAGLLLLALALTGLSQSARAQAVPANPQPGLPGAPLTLAQALQTGLQQSLLVQSSTLEVQRQRALSRTGYDVPRTLVDVQYGQIQGPFNDRSINVIQQTSLPSVYAAQRKLLEGQTLTAEQRVRLQRRLLTQDISGAYYRLLTDYRRLRLLRRQDSLYRRAARAASIRYRTGETNRLEQVSAAARAQELQNRLATLQTQLLVQRQQPGHAAQHRRRHQHRHHGSACWPHWLWAIQRALAPPPTPRWPCCSRS
ncbi:TolC family protein [Hymenobacter humi]|uniref:TolC family protein n=1 Tax=Hymenobacter humi TaxID=1411620 RepID=A0ABW2U405_9BACT